MDGNNPTNNKYPCMAERQNTRRPYELLKKNDNNNDNDNDIFGSKFLSFGGTPSNSGWPSNAM